MIFEQGTLWPLVKATSTSALAHGALEPIITDSHVVVDRQVPFLVRSVSRLASKQACRQAFFGDAPGNPFLPYETALHVADASPTHVCLLNKYNVVNHHLLIVTRQYEPQDELLQRDDFRALWRCMVEYDSLGFYNSSPKSGASQPHKHLQMIPLPLAPEHDSSPIPMDRLFANPEIRPGQISQLQRLPFRHAFLRWKPTGIAGWQKDASCLWTHYQNLLRFVGWDPARQPTDANRYDYNLLVSRQWLLLVPRSRECFGEISLNALAFAGALLVRDRDQLQRLTQAGPFAALEAVTL